MPVELFRTLIMLHDCREEVKEKESFGASLGECDCLADLYLVLNDNKN